MRTILLAVMASLLASVGPAAAADADRPGDASIPFVNHGGIRDWRDDGRDAIYLQDQRGQWYRATFMSPCNDLPFANAVGFETRGIDTFDKFGAVIVRGQRCTVTSFVKSAPPPKKADKKTRSIEQAKPVAPAA